jgi:hypothetical protein
MGCCTYSSMLTNPPCAVASTATPSWHSRDDLMVDATRLTAEQVAASVWNVAEEQIA